MSEQQSPTGVYRHRVSYLYNEQPQQRELEYEQPKLPPEAAALKLLDIHFGATKDARLVPSADASPQDVMDQAQLMGITFIEIQHRGRAIGAALDEPDRATPEFPLAAPSDAVALNESGFNPAQDLLDKPKTGKSN